MIRIVSSSCYFGLKFYSPPRMLFSATGASSFFCSILSAGHATLVEQVSYLCYSNYVEYT